MKLVLDATPLIHSAKTRLHRYFKDLDAELFTTTAIREKALAGGFADRPVIEALLRGTVRVLPSEERPLSKGLHAGEASCVELAARKGAILVADDRIARVVAKAKGVAVVHTSFLILRLLERKAIRRRQAEELLEELIASSWYCDSESVSRLYNAFRDYD